MEGTISQIAYISYHYPITSWAVVSYHISYHILSYHVWGASVPSVNIRVGRYGACKEVCFHYHWLLYSWPEYLSSSQPLPTQQHLQGAPNRGIDCNSTDPPKCLGPSTMQTQRARVSKSLNFGRSKHLSCTALQCYFKNVTKCHRALVCLHWYGVVWMFESSWLRHCVLAHSFIHSFIHSFKHSFIAWM